MPHIAIFPSPGMGHLIPLIELARKLLNLHPNLTITFIIPDDGSPTKPQKSLLQSFPAINSIFLPPSIDQDLPDSKPETRIVLSVVRSIPSLLKALHDVNRSTRLSAFVADLFATITFDAVKGLGIPVHLFFPCSAMMLSFGFYLPKLDESCDCEYRDLPEPVKMPGSCIPVRGSDFPEPVQDRKSQTYRGVVEMCKQFGSADGILVNTFVDLEPDTFKSFGLGKQPPVYHVGPLVRTGSATGSGTKCLEWLDKQPDRSVLFVSFGSVGTLSKHQLNELTAGLEMSRQRFLLVAKSPNDEVKNAAYFTGDKIKMDEHLEYLSADFLERTKEKGYVISQWAPQVEVLSHVAVGGFVTHCGWNSTLESIAHGVPLIAWPLFAEQRMNAVLLSEGLKVAIRVRENENGVVEREQISELARRLMEGEEGEELRKRMRGFKDAAIKALNHDGSSTRALASVAGTWIGQE